MEAADLPEGHLALVVEDLLATVDARRGPGDLAAALLYGWSTGSMSARDVAMRAATDQGLRYLLNGAQPSFHDIRAYRERHGAELATVYAEAFEICRGAGLSRLGRIRFPAPPGGSFVPSTATRRGSAELARQLLAQSGAEDARDDREVGDERRGDELPAELAPRGDRREIFRQIRALLEGGPQALVERGRTPARGELVPRQARDERPARGELVEPRALRRAQGERSAALRRASSAIGALVLVLAGLVAVRWVAFISVPTTRMEAAESFLRPGEAHGAPSEEVDPRATRDEALRLAAVALSLDNLPSARDLYMLALQAVPGDRVAAARLLQVRTALGVGERQRGWEEALADLAELRELAPDSTALLQAYLAALVGAGREALIQGDEERALERCGEAIRWVPSMPEAQGCLARARPEATATPAPTLVPRPTPVPLTPARVPTVPPTVVGEGT